LQGIVFKGYKMKKNWNEIILQELGDAMSRLQEEQLDSLAEALLTSDSKVLCVGVGRVMISLKAWVKRLRHLGIHINYVGSESEDPVGTGDLVLVASASGESIFPVQIAKKAKSVGAKVFYIGCTPGSSVDCLADGRLLVAGRTKFSGPEDLVSIQPMSTLFEQQLYLLCDSLALEIMERKGLTEESVKHYHANLE